MEVKGNNCTRLTQNNNKCSQEETETVAICNQ